MNQVEKLTDIECVEDLLRATRDQRLNAPPGIDSWLYRGQTNGSRPLLPSSGRLPHWDLGETVTQNHDLARFEFWKQRAPFYQQSLPENEWECLSVAQHHGLTTRLLDWSLSPLIGLFFAVSDIAFAATKTDGALWAFKVRRVIEPAHSKLGSVEAVSVFFPEGRTHRVVQQRGAFTYHPDPSKALEEIVPQEDLQKYCVPATAKRNIRKDLDKIGVNFEMLFPDLEGHSKHVNWVTEANRWEHWQWTQSSS
jgi:hypothetical protein